MTASHRVAIYARQSVAEDQGITQQLDDCRAEASQRGWPVVAVFPDDGTSASKDRGAKTKWAMMLDAHDKGEFDVLMVTETSRLTRRLVDILDVRPPRRDIRILVLRQGIDTASSDLGLKMLIIVAEEEVKIKAARAARYAIERRGAGHPTAGMTPHGYRWVPADLRDTKGTRYVVNEDEAQDVRQIFREFLAGGSLGQIARDLTTTGRRTRAGARWHTSTVRRVLLNPLYASTPSCPAFRRAQPKCRGHRGVHPGRVGADHRIRSTQGDPREAVACEAEPRWQRPTMAAVGSRDLLCLQAAGSISAG